MFTLFSISSIDISIVIIFRRVNKPYMPMKNSAVLTNNICDTGIIQPLHILQHTGLFGTG